ncbi:protein ERGIC-53-like [Spea bombifrons]|uniref:protein ERGIC-53-like n=1 Tax=Spea bombifrons TaxID=233779 RepID=UPI002349A693|nr:protein ERGIC-53-like [Spea bombifrons]
MSFPSCVLFLGLLPYLIYAQDEPAHSRFEYKYSFKGPHVTMPDGSVPFWDMYGDALPGPDEVRLVPSMKNHAGSMWTTRNASFPHWEVDVSLRIMGHGRMGSDGLAIWYTKEPGRTGTVYGSADKWDGVAIIFDTFDNDVMGNNPTILIVGNNGKLNYDHSQDGMNQALGSCVLSFRNTIRPFKAKISYYKRTLRVSVQTGLSPRGDAYELCAQVSNMVIPSTGYFGISASTGVLADDHDVLSFMTYSLSKTWDESPAAKIPEDEKEKFLKEFEEFQKELEKNKKDFQMEHPKQNEELFESDSQRELDMVLNGQARLLEELTVLNKRLTMTVEEQRRHRDILSRSAANETTTVKEHVHSTLEVVMNGIPDLLAMTQELKKDVIKVATKVKQSSSPGKVKDSTSPTNFTVVHEDFSKIKRSLQNLVKNSASAQKPPCPPIPLQPSCLSGSIFLTFLLLQTLCSIVYMMLRSKSDSSSKKLY